MADDRRQHADITARYAADGGEIAVFPGRQRRQHLRAIASRTPNVTPHGRHEYQCHGQGGGERGNERNREELHELAHDTRPEQQRHERGESGRGGGRDGPGHAFCGLCIGLASVHAFRHAAVGELGDDDGAIHEHPHRQDQAEQDDDVHGQAEHRDDQDAGQERARYGQPHEPGGAHAQRADDDDHHQDDRGQHVILEVCEHVADLHGPVLNE